MITRRMLIRSASGVLAQVLRAQRSAGGSKIVFKHDVPDLTLKDWSVTAVEVSYGPGESSAAHRHPGITIAYVLEGEIRSKVGDEPERTYTGGQKILAAPRHRAIPIAYVWEGEIRSKVGDEPERTYTVGQMFLETPGQLHAVSGNASATRPAKLLAILLAAKGQQLTPE